MDNYYTGHLLEKQLNLLTDREAKVLGTIKFLNFSMINRPVTSAAIEMLNLEPHGQ